MIPSKNNSLGREIRITELEPLRFKIVNASKQSIIIKPDSISYNGVQITHWTFSDDGFVETFQIPKTEIQFCLSIKKEGYIDYVNNHTYESLNGRGIAMSEIMVEDSMKMILSWGETPSDLDSHLKIFNNNTLVTKIYHGKRSYTDGEAIYTLDEDYTDHGPSSENKPETITVSKTFDNYKYEYYVNNYDASDAGDTGLANSNAKLEWYKGNNKLQTINVPTTGKGKYWKVATYSNGTLTVTNIVTDTNPD